MAPKPTPTVAISTADRAGPRTIRARYENWRPPIAAVTLLVPVGTDLLLTELCGDLLLPSGPVRDGQTPEQAAQQVLLRSPSSLPVHRQVAVDWSQTRRRQVFTHIVATYPLTHADAAFLTYRDGRAALRALPVSHAVAALPELARARVLAGLMALAAHEVVYLKAGVISRNERASRSARAHCSLRRRDRM
ncbi:hypothetical protein GCM10009579_74070 [Streptomyces javensis]|uniref:NUDIX hydrolase n=1 Tax=Streptomyces javensis TaxID=114698 RepID=A0ABN1XAK7_9ACTN